MEVCAKLSLEKNNSVLKKVLVVGADGGSFGELALLNNKGGKRAARIVALGP